MPEDEDVDASYREAFSGLFGADPEEPAARTTEEPHPADAPAVATPAAEKPRDPVSETLPDPVSGTLSDDAGNMLTGELTQLMEHQASPTERVPRPDESGEVKFASTADAAAGSEGDGASGSDGQGSDGQGSDGQGTNGQGSNGQGSNGEGAGDTGDVTAQLSTSWLDLAAAAEEEEDTEPLARITSETPTHTFLDDAGGRNSRASFPIDPSLVDAELPALPPAMFVPGEGAKEPGEGAFEPGGETRVMPPLAKDEEDLGHTTEETTRAMSESDVDDVLRDMEKRVRDLHATSPHDTTDDLVLERPIERPLDRTVPDLRPPEVLAAPPSTARLLETWIRKNAGDGIHFEPVGALEAPRNSVRLGAALEIGRTHLRYLELQPYESGRQVATRFEQVALAEPTGPSVDERLPRITAALAALRQRLGDKIAPCTVLHEQGAIGTRVLTMPVGTRAVDAAVRAALSSNEALVTARRVMGKVRVGTDSIKSVLVSYAPAAEVARIEEALQLTGTTVARITSSQVVFLETVVSKAARLDEDAAEAFVLIERTNVTVALAARGVLLLARVVPLEKEPGTPEWVAEVLEKLKHESNDLERACGGGELARIRYATALPPEIDFPTKDIVVSFGRPAEVIDTEFLFRIDLDSVKRLSIPADAMSSLAPAAYEATLDGGTGLDLGASRTPPAVVAAAWALVAALLVLVLGAAFAWEPDAAHRHQLEGQAELVDGILLRDEQPVTADHEAAVALRAARANLEKERVALDAFAARAPEVAGLLRELAPLRPDGVFYERFHGGRAEKRTTWDIELTAVGTGDKDKAAALVGELVLRLRQTSLADLTTRPATPAVPDEAPVVIGAKTGGVK